MPKISKAQAVYLPPPFVAPKGTSCDTCRDFIKFSSECMITADSKVSGPRGTCTQYLRGKPHEYGQPLKLVPKSIVGYIEGPEIPTFCGRCKHYEHPMQGTSTCEGVGDFEDDVVGFGGCCNLYEVRRAKGKS